MADLFAYNDENKTKMLQVAQYLRGTPHSLEEGLETYFGEEGADSVVFDIKLLNELDDITMVCEGCGWWCETSELDENQLCDNCTPSEDA